MTEIGGVTVMVRTLILSLPICCLSACGGSSSSADGPTDPNQQFSLAVLKSGAVGDNVDEEFVSGTVQTLQGTYPATGSYKLIWVNADTAFSGSAAAALQHYPYLSYSTGPGVFTGSGIRYNFDLDMNSFLLGIRDADAKVTCTPISTKYALPDSGKIGDGGLYLDSTCTDPGNRIVTSRVTWGIKDALAGNVYLELTMENRNASATLIEKNVFDVKLNGAGNVIGLRVNAQNSLVNITAASPNL